MKSTSTKLYFLSFLVQKNASKLARRATKASPTRRATVCRPTNAPPTRRATACRPTNAPAPRRAAACRPTKAPPTRRTTACRATSESGWSKRNDKRASLDTAMRADVIAEGGGNFFDPFFWPRFCPSENISKNHQNFYPQVFAQIKNIRNFAPTMTRKKDRFF